MQKVKLSEAQKKVLDGIEAVVFDSGKYFMFVPTDVRRSGQYLISKSIIDKLHALGLITPTENPRRPFKKNIEL